MIKDNLPVYYNPIHNGLHVVHEVKETTVIVGSCCAYYDDAYTNICRYEIPKTKLNEWQELDKKSLKSYSFIDMKLFNIGIGVKEDGIDGDLKRNSWYRDPSIINRYYFEDKIHDRTPYWF